MAQRARIRERIDEDVARLGGLIENANITGGFGLWGYDAQRHPKAAEALDAAWAFVDDPAGGLLLAGPMGLGKTRLLLGVHFELLCAGIDSRFVLSSELREAFRDAQALDDGVHVPARLFLERLQRARVILWDDAGDIDGDERARGTFAEGIKKLLDLGGASWGLSTNLTGEEFAAHKDLGRKVLSRVLAGARVVKMEGRDQRPGGTRG